MRKASGSFSEHEADTAKRDTPQELLDPSRTAKFSKGDIETMLRTESGTRPSVDRDAIRRHLAAKHDCGSQDEHARPTIDVFSAIPLMPEVEALPVEAPPPPPPLAPAAVIVPLPTPAQAMPPAVARTPRWVVPVVLVGFALFVAAALTAGFVLGRITGH